MQGDFFLQMSGDGLKIKFRPLKRPAAALDEDAGIEETTSSTFVDEQEEEEGEVQVEEGQLSTRRLHISKPKPDAHILDVVSHLFEGEGKDCTDLPLKKDHSARPLWIAPDGHIYLEAFSAIVEQAQDFLVAISEPVSRPTYIHEYKLTPYSLYAAVSVGLETEDIVAVLDRLCKTPLPAGIQEYIRQNTRSYGKVKLVLKHNHYYIESAYPDILQMLLKRSDVYEHVVQKGQELLLSKAPVNQDTQLNDIRALDPTAESTDETALYDSVINEDEDGDDDDVQLPEADNAAAIPTSQLPRHAPAATASVHSFEVKAEGVQEVKRICNSIDYPMLEEYDFHNDVTIPNLPIDLKPTTVIRPYQEKSLSKMFGNGRARSGIIVLPCGAGKTLVGITAACTIKKPALVLCTSGVSVEQWRNEFKTWSTVNDRQIARFTSDCKEKFAGDAGIVISTYTMVAYSGNRSHESKKMMEFLRSTEWGFLLLDEVHVVPANVFRKVLTVIAAHAKLGLTATLVREDEKIEDLNFLIGPKLYEANWLDLSRKGHIANVQCAEVWCPMTPRFYAQYLDADNNSFRLRKLLYVMNPTKIQACQFLIRYHEERGDKIIVFSDDVYALKKYALTLNKPFIYGATSQQERMRILQNFRYNPATNTVFLSKVGDTSIDLPEATCLIQISSHYGSRRQEAQRLGRILRAKRRTDSGFNAFFYSLVSKDTQEMYYSAKRQQFLVDQGYAFKVITGLPPQEDIDLARRAASSAIGGSGHGQQMLKFADDRTQQDLLTDVIYHVESTRERDVDEEKDNVRDEDDISKLTPSGGNVGASKKKQTPSVLKSVGKISGLSGGDGMAYMEYSNKNASAKPRHKLMKKFFSS